jgi:hypothetical protein
MDQSSAAPNATSNMLPDDPAHETGEQSLCAWFGFWAQFFALGILAILGALFAGGGGPGDETAGVILVVAASLLAFLRLKSSFDGAPANWGAWLLVSDIPSLIAMIVIFVILGMTGLFVADSMERGGLHNAGVALFVTSGIGVFLSLKNVFDNLDRRS